MAENSAGRVLLIPKGVFTIGTNYTPLDFVAFGSNNYVCKKATDGTKTPVEDTASWQMLASGFDSHNIAAEYSEEATYHTGDICISAGNLYKAKQDINVAEAFTAGHWEEITVGQELTSLETTKADASDVTTLKEKVGTAALTTTATDLSGAVNEVKTASDANASAITKLNSDLGVSNEYGATFTNAVPVEINLGTSFTAEQSADIRSGKFDKVRVGGYWTINGRKYWAAHADYRLHCGDTELTTHHMLVIPDKSFYKGVMNDTNVTKGGYYGSKMKTSGLANALATVKADFGADHILSHRIILANAVSNGASSGWSWYDSQIDLMNEHMVYGSYAWGGGSQNGYDTCADKSQLALFQARPDLITNRGSWWLRDVQSAPNFCCVGDGGNAGNWAASNSFGVRPAFLIY
ncbi:MAG: hypothetical protein MR754_09915 [Oribacterium sp.]|nr:hypothetical protein [Oribacterium sp.]